MVFLAGTQRLPDNLLRTELTEDQRQYLRTVLTGNETTHSDAPETMFKCFYEAMRHNGQSRLCVGETTRGSTLPNSLAAFQDFHILDLAMCLQTSFVDLIPCGLVFETAEGKYRAMERWHGHVSAQSKNFIISGTDPDAPTPVFSFGSAVRQGAVMSGATVGVCLSDSPDRIAPLQCLLSGGGRSVTLMRSSDGFVVDLADDISVCWWFHHGGNNQ
jgi:hypothetical protein